MTQLVERYTVRVPTHVRSRSRRKRTALRTMNMGVVLLAFNAFLIVELATLASAHVEAPIAPWLAMAGLVSIYFSISITTRMIANAGIDYLVECYKARTSNRTNYF